MINRKNDPTPLKCLQINLQHNSAAAANLSQTLLELNLDIILVQEPYCYFSSRKITNVPQGYKAFLFPSKDFHFGSSIILKNGIIAKPILDICNNEVTGVQIVSHNLDVFLLSVYCRPTLANLKDTLRPVFESSNIEVSNTIICMDCNAHDPLWNSPYTDPKGTELLNIISEEQLSCANILREELSFILQHTSFVDVTLAGHSIRDKILNWCYLDTRIIPLYALI